jgi:hypothetical protein
MDSITMPDDRKMRPIARSETRTNPPTSFMRQIARRMAPTATDRETDANSNECLNQPVSGAPEDQGSAI